MGIVPNIVENDFNVENSNKSRIASGNVIASCETCDQPCENWAVGHGILDDQGKEENSGFVKDGDESEKNRHVRSRQLLNPELLNITKDQDGQLYLIIKDPSLFVQYSVSS
jgi:hypothetical protein